MKRQTIKVAGVSTTAKKTRHVILTENIDALSKAGQMFSRILVGSFLDVLGCDDDKLASTTLSLSLFRNL